MTAKYVQLAIGWRIQPGITLTRRLQDHPTVHQFIAECLFGNGKDNDLILGERGHAIFAIEAILDF